jgi:amino acid adenylation domain-containing protein
VSAQAPLAAAADIEDIYELTPLQHGMIFHSLYGPESDIYVEQVLCAIRGYVDGGLLRRAFERVVERHAVLRTSFHWRGLNKPLQVVMRRVQVPWQTLDWRALSSADRLRSMKDWLEADRSRPFRLDEAPVLRCSLIRLADESYRFIWTFHHVLADGWSLPIVFRHLFTVYDALVDGRTEASEPVLPYRNYVLWRQAYTNPDSPSYWHRRLNEISGPTRLTSGELGARGAAVREKTRRLPATLSSRLCSFTRTHRLTAYSVVLGALAATMARWSGDSDVLFLSTVSGRPAELDGADRMVGLFINALPVRAQVRSEANVLAWLRQLQDDEIERDRHCHDTLSDVLKWSGAQRGPEMFELLLVFENYPTPSDWGGQHAHVVGMQALERTNYPLTLTVIPGESFKFRLTWKERIFESTQATRFLDHLLEVLVSVMDSSAGLVGELPPLPANDRVRLLGDWCGGPSDSVRGRLQDWLAPSALTFPDRPAAVAGDLVLNYRDLTLRVNAFASRLHADGVCPERCVGIALERSPWLLVAILAVLKAGGAYVPIDGSHPRERVRSMLLDAGVGLLVCDRGEMEWLAADGMRLAHIDPQETAVQGPENRAAPDNLAYVIYTSGSTGRPKGCAVSRESFQNLLAWYDGTFAGVDEIRALILTSFGFDLTQKNLLAPLAAGGSVHFLPSSLFDSPYICKQIERERITLINCTPSAFYSLLEVAGVDEYRTLASLRLVVLGGEPIAPGRLAPWLGSRHCYARVVNSYGPTECADISASHWLQPGEGERSGMIPIGNPIPNSRLYVLDERMQLVPIGAAGELYIGGVGVGRGYARRAGLTADRFAPDPYTGEPGARLYRTGDHVRYRGDGRLEFLGRRDDQIKVRGHRIELGEVESVLRTHPAIAEAVVQLEEGGTSPRLIAFYVVRDGAIAPGAEQLKTHLRRFVPNVMIPSVWVELERLPLTPNAKLDRRRLRRPRETDAQSAAVPEREGRTTLERELAAIWSEVLDIPQIAADANFFDLGGHSLIAFSVISRIEQRLGVELQLRQVFDSPTIQQLADIVAVALESGKRREMAPLTSLPRRHPAKRTEPIANE